MDKEVDKTMMRLAVIGKPIDHSLSPIIHNEFALQTGVDISYRAFEVDPKDFRKTVASMFNDRRGGYYGLNVTLPLKQLAFKYCVTSSEECLLTESANTLTAYDEGGGCSGEFIADTTDGKGFVEDIRQKSLQFEGLSLEEDIVIIGAGGSAMSIISSILADYPKSLTVVNRSIERAKKIKEKFSSKLHQEINILGPQDPLPLGLRPGFVINCSSAGTLNQPIILPNNLFIANPWVYDLAYSKEITPFNKIAKDAGVEVCFDGLGMLVNQAAESFYIWTGKRPSTQGVLDFLDIEWDFENIF